jgi:hypothetical protein
MRPDTPRGARKKLLLLQGTLYRLEILEAKAVLRNGVANSIVGRRLPGILSFLFQHKGSALLTSVLPLLLGAGRVSRIVRNGALVAGAAAALMGLLKRWSRGDATTEPAQDGNAESAAQVTDEKNPGQGRD